MVPTLPAHYATHPYATCPLRDPPIAIPYLPQMTRCLYTDFLREETEPSLLPVFWALHEATFKGVPGYSFDAPEGGVTGGEGDDATGCTFWFNGA